MTAGERAVWAAVYAASWHQSAGGPAGRVDDVERARWSAHQAGRALDALRALGPGAAVPDLLTPVVREVLE